MAKRITRYILIALGLVTLWVSTSTSAMEYIWTQRRGDNWWESSGWKNGNLVGMAHLDMVRKFVSPIQHADAPPKQHSETKNAILYLVGDSYTETMKESQFTGISEFHFINRYTGGEFRLDRTKNNILIIEIAEYWTRDYFQSDRMIHMIHAADQQTSVNYLSPAHPYPAMAGLNIYADLFFNKNINKNIERLLFHFNALMTIFQCKAALNYYCFDRASGDVNISKNKDYLLDGSSISAEGHGVYSALHEHEVYNLVHVIDDIYNNYKRCGFKEIYLSIIPTTGAIIEPDGYNQLIPLIQNDPQLSIKVLDAYTALSDVNKNYFKHGDTHWNANGEQLWIDMVNTILINNQTLQ